MRINLGKCVFIDQYKFFNIVSNALLIHKCTNKSNNIRKIVLGRLKSSHELHLCLTEPQSL